MAILSTKTPRGTPLRERWSNEECVLVELERREGYALVRTKSGLWPVYERDFSKWEVIYGK